MKVLGILLATVVVVVMSEAPYPPSGWKPNGPQLALPSRQSAANGNYGPPPPPPPSNGYGPPQQPPTNGYGPPPAQPPNGYGPPPPQSPDNGYIPPASPEAPQGAYPEEENCVA